MTATTFPPGTLVRARGRDWLVIPGGTDGMLRARPLGGSDAETTLLLPRVRPPSPGGVRPAHRRRPRRRQPRPAAARRVAAVVSGHRRPVPLLRQDRRHPPQLSAGAADDGRRPGHHPAADRRRRRHRQDRRSGPDRGRTAGHRGRRTPGGAVLPPAGPAVAGRAADQVRHRRPTLAALDGQPAATQRAVRIHHLPALPVPGDLHRLHQAAHPPRRIRRPLPGIGDRRRSPHLRRRPPPPPSTPRPTCATRCCASSPTTRPAICCC